jgi:hypothetical protein
MRIPPEDVELFPTAFPEIRFYMGKSDEKNRRIPEHL